MDATENIGGHKKVFHFGESKSCTPKENNALKDKQGWNLTGPKNYVKGQPGEKNHKDF